MFYADKPFLTDCTLLRHTLILHTSDRYQPPCLVDLTPICLRRGNPMRWGTAVKQCECFIKRVVPGLSKPVTLTFTQSGISFMRAFKICKMITFVELYTFISAACNRENRKQYYFWKTLIPSLHDCYTRRWIDQKSNASSDCNTCGLISTFSVAV